MEFNLRCNYYFIIVFNDEVINVSQNISINIHKSGNHKPTAAVKLQTCHHQESTLVLNMRVLFDKNVTQQFKKK